MMHSGLTWLKDGLLGEWWHPSSASQKHVGVLRKAGNQWRLETYGVLGSYLGDSLHRRYDRLCGWSPGAGFLELQSCVGTRQRFLNTPKNFEREIERIDFSRRLRKSVGGPDFLGLYQSIEVSAPQLFNWIGRGGLSVIDREGGQFDHAYGFKDPDHISCAWGPWSVRFWMRAGSFPYPAERVLKISQDYACSITSPDALPFENFESRSRSLSAFFSLISGERISLECFAASGADECLKPSVPFDVFINRANLLSDLSQLQIKTAWCFSFAEVQPRLHHLLNFWDELIERHGSPIVQFFSSEVSDSRPGMFIDSANLLHSILEKDASQQGRKRISFREAIYEAVKEFGLLEVGEIEVVVDQIKATRHAMTHPNSALKERSAEQLDLANITSFVEALLRCQLWKRLGITHDEIKAKCRTIPELNDKLSLKFWSSIE